MHKIWLVNLEEVIGHGVIKETLHQHLARYLHFVNSGDMFFSTVEIDNDFIDYVSSIRGLHRDRRWYVRLHNLSLPYYLADSILQDASIRKMLLNLAATKNYQFDPFIETPRICHLSRVTSIPAPGTSPQLIQDGLIRKFNEKTYFRKLSEKLAIPTARGLCVDSPAGVRKALDVLCPGPQDHAVMKKSFSGGGYGNLMGDRDVLTGAVPSWCDGGQYVVEELLDLKETIGSLVVLSDESVDFVGTNAQIIHRCSWKGCRFPFVGEEINCRIKKMSLLYGREIHRAGGRGLLNVDWGLVAQNHGKSEIFALEINLRRNGFNYILHVGRENFDLNSGNMHLKYYGSFDIAPELDTFRKLLEVAQSLRIEGMPLCEPGRKLPGGIVFTAPPRDQRAGILIGGGSEQMVERIEGIIRDKLGRCNESS